MVIIHLLLLGLALGSRELLDQGYEYEQDILGVDSFTKIVGDDKYHTIANMPDVETQRESILNLFKEAPAKLVQNLRGSDKTSGKSITCDSGEGPDFFRWAPQWVVGAQKDDGIDHGFSSSCFQNTTFTFDSYDSDSITVKINAQNPSSHLCYDSYWIATVNHIYIKNIFFHGEHTITIKNIDATDWVDVNQSGVRLFRWCDDITTLIMDLGMTLELFLGGFSTNSWIPIFGSHTTWYMENSNRKFLKEAMGYDMPPRKIKNVYQDIDINLINSGDFLAITRLDGLDEIIMWGTGGHVGHSTMAIWLNITGERELYVMESQDGWYWPRHGIQMNKFSQWIEWAQNASFNVVALPLKEEYAKAFNETAVYEWFKTVEGLPYGYHNLLFGWIDTVNENFPPILQAELFPIAFRLVEKVVPSAIKAVYGLPLNKRLGTTDLEIPELVAECAKRNLTINEVMTWVEQDAWEYPDGYSMVCSSFVAAAYKRAGILDESIQATEMAPRDVTQLSLFDKNWTRPDACVKADPDLPYCQLIGDYQVRIGDYYSTVDPYPHMSEHCPSQAPDYYRPGDC